MILQGKMSSTRCSFSHRKSRSFFVQKRKKIRTENIDLNRILGYNLGDQQRRKCV